MRRDHRDTPFERLASALVRLEWEERAHPIEGWSSGQLAEHILAELAMHGYEIRKKPDPIQPEPHGHVYTWISCGDDDSPPMGTPCMGCGHPYEGTMADP